MEAYLLLVTTKLLLQGLIKAHSEVMAILELLSMTNPQQRMTMATSRTMIYLTVPNSSHPSALTLTDRNPTCRLNTKLET
jgi:hypothetical protein